MIKRTMTRKIVENQLKSSIPCRFRFSIGTLSRGRRPRDEDLLIFYLKMSKFTTRVRIRVQSLDEPSNMGSAYWRRARRAWHGGTSSG